MKIKSPYVLGELAKLGVEPKPKREPRAPRPPSPLVVAEPGHYAAMMHVKLTRKGTDRAATWFDVRDAYHAGYRAGFTAGKS